MKKLKMCLIACVAAVLFGGCNMDIEKDELGFDRNANEFYIIGDTKMYYNIHTEEVMAKSGTGKYATAANLHYQNYILHFSGKAQKFYYYDYEGKVVMITKEQLEYHPDLSEKDGSE